MHSDKYDPYSSLNQRIIDTVIAGTAFWMAYELRFEGRIPVAFEYQLWVCLPWVVLLQIIVNNLLGTYQMIWRYTSLADVVVLARNYALFFLGLILFAYGAQWGNPLLQVPPALISIAFLLSLSGGLSARALRRVWYEGVSSKPRDGAKALRVARAIETGVLSINSNTSVRVATPFGGFKQSGVGRELGPDALEHYTEEKNVFYATEEG